MDNESTLLYHTSCECGSSDARAVYDDGHSYCFSCNKFYASDGTGEAGEVKRDRTPTGLIEGSHKALSKRGLTETTTKKFNYQVGTYQGEPVQISNYYANGKVVAQHLRYPDKRFKWLGEPSNPELQLFGQNRAQGKGKRIVITEGEIDAMSVAQAFGLKWPVVSVPNGATSAVKYVSRHVEWLNNFEDVVLCFDGDEPGRKASEEVARLFSNGKVRIVEYPTGSKDANELLVAGKPDEITKLVYDAKVWRPDGIVSGQDMWETMEDFYNRDPMEGSYSTPYPELNTKTYGVRKGELVTYTAGSGIGKSTLVAEIGHELLVTHGLKVGYVALEEDIRFSALRMMSIALNRRLHLDKEGVTKAQYKKAYDTTVGTGRLYLYNHFGSLDSGNLLSRLNYLAVACECDFIILDHVSIAVSGIEDGDERRIIDNLMTQLRSLAERTEVGMLIVSHLRKKSGQGKSHEEGGIVSPSELRGSGSIYQLSDIVVALERNVLDDEDQHVAKIKVMKNRYSGDTGSGGFIQYNVETGRLLPTDPEILDDFSDGEAMF